MKITGQELDKIYKQISTYGSYIEFISDEIQKIDMFEKRNINISEILEADIDMKICINNNDIYLYDDYNKIPIILDSNLIVLDGYKRLATAYRLNDQKITAYIEVSKSDKNTKQKPFIVSYKYHNVLEIDISGNRYFYEPISPYIKDLLEKYLKYNNLSSFFNTIKKYTK